MNNIVQIMNMNQKMMNFLRQYGQEYGERKTLEIMKNYMYVFNNLKMANIMYWQIFSGLDLLEPDKDIYQKFLNKLKEYFSLKQKIVEIGCGYYPALAKLIDTQQTLQNAGSIDVYDDKLVTHTLGNIGLHKELFTGENVRDYDLLISTLAHDASNIVIEKANYDRKPFFMILCNCVPSGYLFTTDWHNELYKRAKSSLDSGAVLDVDHINTLDRPSSDNMILVKTYR